MGNDTFQLRCFREISFTGQLINILCREGEELKPFYKRGGDNLIDTVASFVVNWSFSNIDLEMEKKHPLYSKCRRKDEYDNDWVKSFK